MPWKMVTRHGKNMTLKEAVDRILNQKESENRELERRNREQEEIENKHTEYYEKHMKEETEKLNELVDWYKCKLNEIREAPVDSRPRKLEKLYRYSEKNKDLGVMITRFGTLNPVDCPKYILPNWNYLNTRIMKKLSFTTLQQQVHCLLDVNHIINLIISKS